MKKTFLAVAIFFVVISLSACGEKDNNQAENEISANDQSDQASQDLFKATADVSREYVNLRIKTENILTKASAYSDHTSWNSEMTEIIEDWKNLENESITLEKLAEEYSKEKTSFRLINKTQAYSKQEISNVFDRAPAGKKIKTLAKFLGVDAKRAYKILQQDQAQVEADAWNEAGDTFQKLETSAVVIKDGCKVTAFTGGVILTGGAGGFAAASTLSQTAVVVAGADLVLEVSSDAANISLGNNNKVSEIVGDIRVITEPAAAILAIVTMPDKLVTGLDKLNVFVFGAEQFNSTVQEGKVIGIELPAYKKDKKNEGVEMTVIDKNDIDNWLNENGYERHDGDVEEIFEAYNEDEEDDKDDKDEENTDEKKNILDVTVDTDSGFMIGNWKGTTRHTPGQNKPEEVSETSVTFNSDGSLSSSSDEKFGQFTWKKEGSSVKFFTDESGEGYYDFVLSGDTLTFTKLAGPNSEGDWVEVMAGEDFFGGKFIQMTLKKQ